MNTDCFCGLTPEIMKLRIYFGRRPLFYFIFCFLPQNSWKFARFLRWKTEFVKVRALFQMKTLFFFGLHLRMRGYSRWTLFSFSPHSRIQINKLLVPPQSRYPGARPTRIFSELEILLINYYVLER